MSAISASLRDLRLIASVAALCVLGLGGCTSNPFPSFSNPFASSDTPADAPMGGPAIPASVRPEEIVGRWGYGAYHKDADRTRTEAAARGQCGQPVIINRGPNGGVMMYLADSAQLQELALKGSQTGQNYIGPPGPAGGPQDREIVSLDGHTMILRWMNTEVSGRYGTGVYVRCGPEGVARRAPAR